MGQEFTSLLWDFTDSQVWDPSSDMQKGLPVSLQQLNYNPNLKGKAQHNCITLTEKINALLNFVTVMTGTHKLLER